MNNITFAIIVFFLAFPFGFWRAQSRFKSRDWMLAIHIPVVFIIVLRIYNKLHYNIGFSWQSLAYNIIAFMAAQYIAGVLCKRFICKKKEEK